MCVTKELKHLLCQHTDKYTKECLSKRGSLLGRLSKCNPRTQTTNQYDLCHECRRYWAEHQVSEQEATRSYVSYRAAHDHDGPLAPTFILSVSDVSPPPPPPPRNSSTTTSESSSSGRETQPPGGGAGVDGPSGGGMLAGLQNLTPLLYGRGAAANDPPPDNNKRASGSSVATQWPSPFELESDWVQRSKSHSQFPPRSGEGDGSERERAGEPRRLGRSASARSAAPTGVLLLAEEGEDVPKWI